jgi:hypothetical protein
MLDNVNKTNCTNMHVHNHSISFIPTDSGRDYNQGVPRDEIPYASF